MVVTPARQTLKIKYSTPHRKKKAPCHIKAAKMLDAPRRRYYNKRAGFARHTHRGVAQLVARVVWDHEAAGSSPVTSTSKMP